MKSLGECDYEFQKFVLKMETKAENLSHPEDLRPYCCENCGRQFSTSAYLSQHRRIHSGVKPYVCRFCDRKFTQLSHVQQHERIHTGEKPYSCGTCMKSFTQMSNLHSHQRQHMKNKPCKCSNCFMAFDVQQDLENHIESKHTAERYRKILVCPVCSKMYNSETYLTKHVERHDESSSKSSNSSKKSLLQCEPMNKYVKQNRPAKSYTATCNSNVISPAVSQALGFSTSGGEMKECLVPRPVNNMSMALDISKSIVTATSGLRLDVFLEGLASSNCPSPLVSAAASVWGHSWFPSPSNAIIERNHHPMKAPEKVPNRSMCADLLSLNKQSALSSHSMMSDMLHHDMISSSLSQPPSVSLPTLSHITEKFITFSDPSNIPPHINSLTTAFP